MACRLYYLSNRWPRESARCWCLGSNTCASSSSVSWFLRKIGVVHQKNTIDNRLAVSRGFGKNLRFAESMTVTTKRYWFNVVLLWTATIDILSTFDCPRNVFNAFISVTPNRFFTCSPTIPFITATSYLLISADRSAIIKFGVIWFCWMYKMLRLYVNVM